MRHLPVLEPRAAFVEVGSERMPVSVAGRRALLVEHAQSRCSWRVASFSASAVLDPLASHAITPWLDDWDTALEAACSSLISRLAHTVATVKVGHACASCARDIRAGHPAQHREYRSAPVTKQILDHLARCAAPPSPTFGPFARAPPARGVAGA